MKSRTDWLTFITSSGVVLAIAAYLLADPDAGAGIVQSAYDFVAETLGPVFLLAGIAVFAFLIWLSFSPHGNVKLGPAEGEPEFSSMSWVAMLFAAGVGAGLMYWAAIEWAYYLDSPPFGVEPRSAEAIEWASAYGLFHWGPSAWAFYCLPALAIALPYHRLNQPFLRLSTACSGFESCRADKPAGRLIDLVFIVSLLGGAGSSLGFSTPMIAALISRLAGLENSFGLEVAVMIGALALFATSAALGLKAGIRNLSNLNMVLILIFLVFVFLAGPTLFLLEASVGATGLVAQNFIRMSTWTEAFADTGFVQDWTIFYWAWWIAYGPVVGLFVARISRGRTIAEVIWGMIIFGTLGGCLFYMILGNYGLHLEINNSVPISALLNDEGGAQAIVAILSELPFAELAMLVFCATAIVFAATTYDSASYILASSAERPAETGREPAVWQRLYWAAMLGVLPVTLMFIGGLRVVQTATLLASVPLLVIGVIMARSLMRQLTEIRRAS